MGLPLRLLMIPALGLLALAPSSGAYADSAVPAGFAPSVWLSRANPTEGDSVKVYATVYDATDDAIAGTVRFFADDASIGTAGFSLAAGASAIESISWTATAGQHALTAQIEGAANKRTGTSISLGKTDTPLMVAVAAAPPPSAAVAAISGAATAANSAIAAATPAIASAAHVILSSTESIRAAGEDYFASRLAGSSAGGAEAVGSTSGAVLGTSTYRAAPQVKTAIASGLMHSVDQGLFSVFASPALFYLILIVMLIFLFWLIGRRFSNRNA